MSLWSLVLATSLAAGAGAAIAGESGSLQGSGQQFSGWCTDRLCQPEQLTPVVQKLADRQPVHIMMIGDSLTAGDAISHGWRQALDTIYGSTGRGVVDGARPYRGYLTWGIDAQASSGWRINGIFGNAWQGIGSPAVGLSGWTKSASTAGEWMTLTAEDARYTFDRFVLCGQAGPYSGSVMVSMGYESATIPFYSETRGPMCREVRSSSQVQTVMVRTLEDKLITINSMGTFRSNGSGVTLTNLGVPGSQLSHADRKDGSTVYTELRAYRPDLVVVAIGTNEGFNPGLDIAAYEANLRSHIRNLQLQTPAGVPIMLIGPPNAMTRNESVAHAGQVPPIGCETGLLVPGNLRHVASIQRRVAQEMGLAFWDWGMAMGGPCAMYAWREAGLTARDAIHIKKEGGERLGAILTSDIFTAFRMAGAPAAQALPTPSPYPANGTGVEIIR